MIGIGRLTKSSRRNARNTGRFHQAANAMNANVQTGVPKRLANAKTAVGASAFPMRPNDLFTKSFVGHRTGTRNSAAPFVVARRRNSKQLAHPTHARHCHIEHRLLREKQCCVDRLNLRRLFLGSHDPLATPHSLGAGDGFLPREIPQISRSPARLEP